ncbi:hypothetical protein J2R98_001248 [Alkalibacillus filiformis]|uniref:N-acetyltransferase domain-containing protein n=1 Tax=Alkalibacillus filiformis TaxID=200990 RepID=A0ABU0DSL8_9BACI|nr:hypothetical protein [Alkalibacillus filiformis]MDQ0351434.1 hypothetical protein [Alkalibacillus filiformis]
MKPLNLKPASKKDFNFIDQLCQLSASNQAQWLGDPKIKNLEDLQEKITEYENFFHHCVLTIELDGKPAGFTGLLYKEGDLEATIIGPVLLEQYHTTAFLQIVLDELIGICLNTFDTIYIKIANQNKNLIQSIDEQKWVATNNSTNDIQSYSLKLKRALTL